MSDDELLLQRFEACAIPKDQWQHVTHVKVAYLYLCRYAVADAIDKMRVGIKALNAANGTVDSPTGGYHETITQAWMRVVASLLSEFGRADTAESFIQTQPQLSQKSLLEQFYSRELLMSLEARTQFVEPDVAPLPLS